MVVAPTPVEIFCASADADEAWLRKLETHLSLLKRQGLVSFWSDRLIVPGTDWAKTIDAHLETASVILLLISADFFASDYCYGTEMKRALEREAVGKARVVPILVRPVDWKGAPFAHLDVLPTDAKPLSLWRNQDAALAAVTAGIRRVIVEELPQLVACVPLVALPNIWNIPYPRNPFFLGRNEILSGIWTQFQQGQAARLSQPQALSGLGGIGKTQIAIEYAYRYRHEYTHVFWANTDSLETLYASYKEIARLLNLPNGKENEHHPDVIVETVKAWLNHHQQGCSSWIT